MAEPGRLMGQNASTIDPEDLDADGEYEEDDMEYGHVPPQQPQDDGGNTTDAEGSDVDAEGEEIDEDEDSEPVGAVKIAAPADPFSEDEEQDADAAGDSFSDAKTSDSEAESSESESDAEHQWQAESEDGEEQDAEKSDPNVCVWVISTSIHGWPGPNFKQILQRR
jgi:histone acetyltransferase SAS3